MPTPAVGRVDADLLDLLTLRIDPMWPHRSAWRHPLGDKIAFTYVDMEAGFSENSTPNYGDTEVLGRAELFKTYSGTSNKEIPVTFQFRAQGRESLDLATASRKEVVLPARFLDALKYPVYDPDAGVSYAPPPCLLRIGNLLSARVVVTAADIQWIAPFDTETLMPLAATVQATFSVVRQVDKYLRYNFDGDFY